MANKRSQENNLVLSVNAGSSSLKISLYNPTDDPNTPIKLKTTSYISNISSPPASFSFQHNTYTVKHKECHSIKDHASAFDQFLSNLKAHADISPDQIAHVCHRAVHGGEYPRPVIINNESYHHIEVLSDLAPLHNGPALSVIKLCIAALPHANSIAYFDSAFHRSIPPHISSYPIDPDIAKQRGLKKYGFHGLSYAFILRSVAQYLNTPSTSLNLIVLHLGSGASICAIKEGCSLDTSMGLTPLSGLPGATRSGDIDPCLLMHYAEIHENGEEALKKAENMLNKASGWKALAGTTDLSEIVSKADLTHPSLRPPSAGVSTGGQKPGSECSRETLTLALFVDRLIQFIGAYYLKLGGRVDALVFSGGIGENSQELRAIVARFIRCLGFAPLDGVKNGDLGDMAVVDIAAGGDGKRILVCKTDEQAEMARECVLDDRT